MWCVLFCFTSLLAVYSYVIIGKDFKKGAFLLSALLVEMELVSPAAVLVEKVVNGSKSFQFLFSVRILMCDKNICDKN